MNTSKKPHIHLWIYNHPFTGISDQVDFFVMALKQYGYSVSIGRQPSDSSLNVVIENFSAQTKMTLINYCKSSRKRVAVIMTEHIDFENDEIYIHGSPLWSNNDYMHPETQVARLRSLIDCLPYIRCFFVLGDLPELRNMSKMLPGLAVRSIPFPKLDFVSNKDAEKSGLITSDLLFTGFITDYRTNILDILKKSDISFACPEIFVSRKRRDAMNRSAKLVLNIPQRANWRWLSLMRIVAALRCGRATISLGTMDDSRMSACCLQLDVNEADWINQLEYYVDEWEVAYQQAYENYSRMAIKYEKDNKFPHDLFEYWRLTDRVCG
ncbi:MAG: hypothetical protein M0Q44_20475 [Methylobacter sp.]|jgi:hypothetical protein|nr:hypothetical protein [Methylobacter sp.]